MWRVLKVETSIYDVFIKCQDYIESHINHSLSIEDLANVAGFSKFHFHRIFKGMMDEPLSRYVNRLKLEGQHTFLLIVQI